MSDTLAIVNPHAGRADRDRLVAFLAERAEVAVTEAAGDAAELARRAAADGFSRVVAVGGDGTLSEVVDGLMGGARTEVVCGVVPVGTGNDLARGLGVPQRLEEAWRLVEGGRARRIDVASLRHDDGTSWIANAVVGGMVEAVDESLSDAAKRRWGPLAYLTATAAALSTLRPYRVRLVFDGEEELEVSAHAVVAANGRWVAGGTPVAPEALLDDGVVDCVVIRAVEGLDIATLGAKVLAGAHLGPPPDERVVFRRCSSLEIAASPALAFHADGELLRADPIRLEVAPRALPMIHGREPPALSKTGRG